MPGKWIREYLSFTLKERVAIIILSIMIIVVFLLPKILPERKAEPDPEEIRQLKALANALENGREDSLRVDTRKILTAADRATLNSTRKPEAFIFDPNMASYTDWERLGLREKTI